MKNLLLRSMVELAPLVIECLSRAEARQLVEIGSGKGAMSRHLAQYCAGVDGALTCIDPQPRAEFSQWVDTQPHVTHIAQPSLAALSEVGAADGWVIDGDHNYYTVYHELRETFTLAASEGRPYLVFVHDISWPHGRRDSYYTPNAIPAEFLHPHAYGVGMVPGESRARLGRGMRCTEAIAIALNEGGHRNGVLCAVEDFQYRMAEMGHELVMVQIPAMFGLGVMFDARAPWAETMAAFLLPYHHNDWIAKMEHNRVANHIALMALHDRIRTQR